MAKKKTSGGTPATVALARAGVEHTVHTYEHDPAAASYGLEAAEAMGIGRLVVGVVPVSGQLDLKAVAAAAGGKKAVMAEPADAERATGYVVGGISPLGQKRAHPTVVDESALGHTTVFVSGGRRGMEIELSPADLVVQTKATVALIGR